MLPNDVDTIAAKLFSGFSSSGLWIKCFECQGHRSKVTVTCAELKKQLVYTKTAEPSYTWCGIK